MTRPDWCPEDIWAATETGAKERADWLVDAVATSTQNRVFLRGDPDEDTWATDSILLNGEKAIRIASARAVLAERERLLRTFRSAQKVESAIENELFCGTPGKPRGGLL